MNSSEDENNPHMDDHEASEMNFIANEVKANPEILSKSQTPNMKMKKEVAILKVTQKYNTMFSKNIDSLKLKKKINNMKSRLKKKTDLNQTGNRRINLSDWEKILFEAMEGNSNPTVTKIPGKTFLILIKISKEKCILLLYYNISLYKLVHKFWGS